jgi:predicted aspartyl protease
MADARRAAERRAPAVERSREDHRLIVEPFGRFVETRYTVAATIQECEAMLRLMMIAALAGTAGGAAQPDAAAEPPPTETIDYSEDVIRRMTVPVSVGGQGPFNFIVDTGAERTVISRELAATLRLPAGRDIWLTSLTDSRQVPTVIIPELGVGRRTVGAIRAPALAQRNLGAQGMLGIDSLQNQRVVIDFDRRELRLTPSRVQAEVWPADTIVVQARTRLGRMVLTDALVDGQRVAAIIDTGSAVTIGNLALRNRLLGQRRIDPNRMIELTSVTGDRVTVNYTLTRRIRLGEARVHDLPIAFADLEMFRQLELTRRPALIIGMDVLQLFDRVSIDFATRRLRLLPGPRSQAPSIRLAAAP